MTNTASDVLIVGAGPTGLTLACTARSGMPFLSPLITPQWRVEDGESALFVVRPDNYIGMAALEPVAAPIIDCLSRHIATAPRLNS
jgi:hypothetical protein